MSHVERLFYFLRVASPGVLTCEGVIMASIVNSTHCMTVHSYTEAIHYLEHHPGHPTGPRY